MIDSQPAGVVVVDVSWKVRFWPRKRGIKMVAANAASLFSVSDCHPHGPKLIHQVRWSGQRNKARSDSHKSEINSEVQIRGRGRLRRIANEARNLFRAARAVGTLLS